MSPRWAALALLVVVAWGVNFVVIDEGLHGVPPLLFAAIRFVLVGVPAVVVVRRPDAPWTAVVAIGLTMSAGQFALLYLALKAGMPPGLASIVLQSQVVITVVLAGLVLGERVGAVQTLGLAIGVGGLVLVGLGRTAQTPVLGLLLTVGAAASWALGNVASRRLRIKGGLPLVVWSALVVPPPLLVASALVEGPGAWARAARDWGWLQTWSTLYTVVVSTLFGYAVWNGLLARYPAARVVPFALLVPVFGVAAAWAVQGTLPGSFEAIGGAILLVGAAVAVLAPPARTTALTSPRSPDRP